PTFIGVPGMVRIPGENIWVSFGVRCTRTALCPESIEQSGVRLSSLWRREQPPACIDSQTDGDFSCDYDNHLSPVTIVSRQTLSTANFVDNGVCPGGCGLWNADSTAFCINERNRGAVYRCGWG